MVSHDVAAPTEGVVHTESNVSIYCGDEDQGSGTLYITENTLLWKNDSKTLKFFYPSISLHAICRDTVKFPHECIYCLVDSESVIETEDEVEDEEPVSEVRFVPQNKENLKQMYDAITQCQELNPDPDEELSEEEGGQSFEGMNEDDILQSGEIDMSGFYTAEDNIEDIELSEQGMQILQRLQENMRISANGNGNIENNGNPNGQFEDAEE